MDSFSSVAVVQGHTIKSLIKDIEADQYLLSRLADL